MDPWIIWTIIRLGVPFAILRWPFWGTILAVSVDLFDYGHLLLTSNADFATYQRWDKTLDLYYLSFAAYTSLSWTDKIAKKISIIAFLYRALGVILFSFIQIRPLLFLFPNFFESFFLFYHIYRFFAGTDKLFISRITMVVVIIALLIPKLIQEYLMHASWIPPADLFASIQSPFLVPFLFGSTPPFVQWLAYLFLPAIVLYWSVTKVRGQKVTTRTHELS